MDRSGDKRGSQERYEPLPDLHLMPVWLWRRMSPFARAALVGTLLLAAVAAVALAPGIREAKRESARKEAAELRAAEAQRTRTLLAAQRPRTGRAADGGLADATPAVRLASRGRLVATVRARILADARARRLTGRLRRVSCTPFPRGVDGYDPHRDLRRRRGDYACLVVTADIPPSTTNLASVIGHPYRVLIDFRSGRYAFCKIAGVPGEGAFSAKRRVTVPKACGG